MNGTFEAHIVYPPQYRSLIEDDAKAKGYSVSAIVGDDELGDDKLLYLTKRSDSFDNLYADVKTYLMAQRVKAIRYKIEATIIDVRL